MIEKSFQKNILIPLLEHFVGIHVFGIKIVDNSVIFKTEVGSDGFVSRNINGDWDIIIENEVIYEVEDELIDVLIPKAGKMEIEDYYEKLNTLLSCDLKYRSRSLVLQIVKTLEYFILNAQISPSKPIKIGPFLVYTDKIKGRNIICLN